MAKFELGPCICRRRVFFIKKILLERGAASPRCRRSHSSGVNGQPPSRGGWRPPAGCPRSSGRKTRAAPRPIAAARRPSRSPCTTGSELRSSKQCCSSAARSVFNLRSGSAVVLSVSFFKRRRRGTARSVPFSAAVPRRRCLTLFFAYTGAASHCFWLGFRSFGRSGDSGDAGSRH